ncbi:MAG: type I methionyl aminopeptidase [Chloroflexota bacterium]|nr:MAG: type I methionyl aminopeptidase [Chloroflexota bacterium]
MMSDRPIVIKNQPEIELMREAGKVNALVLKTLEEMIQPGISTQELDAVAEDIILQNRGKPAFKNYPGPYPYPATLTISINEELVHGIPGKRKLKEGDLVSIDCGTVLDGFVADSAFSTGVGEISPEVRKLLEVTEKALYLGIEKLRLGNRVGDVSAAIQTFVESHNFHVPREYTGHGVGRNMHEGPLVPNFGTSGRGIPLRPGITVAVEPMVMVGTHKTRVLEDQWTVISADRSLTAHFEHSVAVTEAEPIILTAL